MIIISCFTSFEGFCLFVGISKVSEDYEEVRSHPRKRFFYD